MPGVVDRVGALESQGAGRKRERETPYFQPKWKGGDRCLAQQLRLGIPTLHVRMSGFKFQFHFLHPGRQQVMAQGVRSLPSTWETQMEFQAHEAHRGPALAVGHLGNEPVGGISLLLFLFQIN